MHPASPFLAAATAEQLAALTSLVVCLPPAQRSAYDAAQQPGGLAALDTEWVSQCGRFVRVRKHLGLEYGRVVGSDWVEWLEAEGGFAAVGSLFGGAPVVWLPACVLQVPIPRPQWSEAQRAEYGAAHATARDQVRPLRPRLLGAWSAIKIFPDLWRHDRLPLSRFTAANARRLMTLRAATTDAVATFFFFSAIHVTLGQRADEDEDGDGDDASRNSEQAEDRADGPERKKSARA